MSTERAASTGSDQSSPAGSSGGLWLSFDEGENAESDRAPSPLGSSNLRPGDIPQQLILERTFLEGTIMIYDGLKGEVTLVSEPTGR